MPVAGAGRDRASERVHRFNGFIEKRQAAAKEIADHAARAVKMNERRGDRYGPHGFF